MYRPLYSRDNEAYVVAARVDREELNLNATIRAEQDAAFQETLRQDQEKERKRREEEEAKRRAEEEEARLIREEQDRVERIRRLKVELASEVPDEPAEGDAAAVRMLFKLPSGKRLERRFLRSHPLRALRLYVFCHPDSPDDFDLTTNFPRRVLRCKEGEDEEAATLEEAGLGQPQMFFVNDLDA